MRAQFPHCPRCGWWILAVALALFARVGRAKWVEGHLQTSENWVFLARFCFLSNEGQFEYQIEFNQDVGTPNLLLYYDDESQWPSVYHTGKTCLEKESVLNKKGQNQIITLSPLSPINDFSGCVMRTVEMDPLKKDNSSKTNVKKYEPGNNNADEQQHFLNATDVPSYYDQFLVTSSNRNVSITIETTSTTFTGTVEPTEQSSTEKPPDPKDSIELLQDFSELMIVQNDENLNDSDLLSNLKDVETFPASSSNSHSVIKRYAAQYETSKKFNVDPPRPAYMDPWLSKNKNTKVIVVCHNSRRFHSVRERWWFIALSNCNKTKNLDVKYKFLMTNGPEGDYWHEHFSADEFYILPVLMAFCFAYVLMIMAMVMCTIELKQRQMLHTTYKMFAWSVCFQQGGILLQSMAYVKYAVNGVGSPATKIVGQVFCSASETTYLLLLILMAKGYTITRARLKTTFTIKLTIFTCFYASTYCALFTYQAEEFDPGEVLYLYESDHGYGLIGLRILAWFMFAYSLIFTIRKYPEKGMFYYPFSLCGTMWFFAGPIFILTANNYIDKWVRESVVMGVLLLISFCGHISFLLLTLPAFANKNFPYHVRTTQIGVMEVTSMMGGTMDNFGHSVYMPNPNNAPMNQSVIIPLTRRTEELMATNNHMAASAPPLNVLDPHHANNLKPKEPLVSHMTGNDLLTLNNMGPKLSISTQHSAESISSDKAFNHEHENHLDSLENRFVPKKQDNSGGENKTEAANGDLSRRPNQSVFTIENHLEESYKSDPAYIRDMNNPFLVGASMRARKGLLEPIRRDSGSVPPPLWSLAKTKPKDLKPRKPMQNGKSLHEEHNLQGVIGSFPLPQIPKKEEKPNLEMDTISNETDSLILERESTSDGSPEIMQDGQGKLDDTTMALFTVPKSQRESDNIEK